MIRCIQRYLPEYIKRKKLQELFLLTANAFDVPMPKLKRVSYQEYLREYAVFTRKQAKRCINEGACVLAVKKKLYYSAYQLGLKLRKELRIVTNKEAFLALKVIYQMLGIQFVYCKKGEFLINGCFFSDYYDGEVCRLIESLDQGLVAGLFHGGKLAFRYRMTEGKENCIGSIRGGRERETCHSRWKRCRRCSNCEYTQREL